MRAIVGMDTRGQYHPGLRNSREHGAEYKTVYRDYASYADKEQAIEVAHEMLQETFESHGQTRTRIAQDSPQGRFDALLGKLRTPAPKKEAPRPSKRPRSIDR
jgi:hypothetical protein